MPAVNPRRQELEMAKEILAEVFDTRPSDAEEMIRLKLEERGWDEEGRLEETRGARACAEGMEAAEYARTWLQSQYIYLDLDDKTVKDPYWPLG